MEQEMSENEKNSYLEKTIASYNILNDYINHNLSFKNNYESNLSELIKLSVFDKTDYNIDVFKLLFKNNRTLYSIVRSIIIFNFSKIKEKKMVELIDNNFILSLINFYQILYPNDIEKIELFLRVSNGDKAARDKVILDNRGIVYKLAYKYQYKYNLNDNFDDLISEGTIALIKAVDNFKLSKNVEFSTYAFDCIEGAIKRFVNTKEGDIKSNLADQLLNYKKNIKLLKEKLGKEPSFDEIATNLKIDKSDIYMLNGLKDDFLSFNNFIKDDGEDTVEMINLIPDQPQQFIDSDINNEMDLLNAFLYSGGLSIIHIYVLIYRYGLGNVNKFTLEKVGKTVGIGREAVSQLEKKALEKIKQIANKYNYDEKTFNDNVYNTRKIFGVYNSKLIRNMPITVLNAIVNNIIHYNLDNNDYLLGKKIQKDNETVRFSKIDNKILNIVSSYILEYDKISIYDALMKLNLEEMQVIYLNYNENTNPQHLFVNKTFNKMLKNKFLEIFNMIIKNLKESKLLFVNFYENFSEYTIEEVDKVLADLSETEKILLHLRFGNDLKNSIISSLTHTECYELEIVIKKINDKLLANKQIDERKTYLKLVRNFNNKPKYKNNDIDTKNDDEIAKILTYLNNNEFNEVNKLLNIYLKKYHYLKYEFVLKTLIRIDLIENKGTFDNLESVLKEMNDGCDSTKIFDCIQYIRMFNQSLSNNQIELAKNYLDIIYFINQKTKDKLFSYEQLENLKIQLLECEKNNNRQKFLTLN